MEKPTKISNKGANTPVEETVLSLFQVGVEKKETKGYTDTASIQSLIDARVLVTGAVTGNQYEFAKAGTVLAIDKRDADDLLNKKRGRACCGGTSGRNLFQLV